MSARALLILSTVLFTGAVPPAARAWTREQARTFAVLPPGSGGPEGLEVGPDGTVYVASFGFDASGSLSGQGQLFEYDASGRLVRQVSVKDSSPHLLGLRWHPGLRKLLVVDFGAAVVWAVDPVTGDSSKFMWVPVADPATTSLNDIELDAAGNVYVSDSFQGTIWRVGSGGGQASAWVSDPLLTTKGVPPFGANGLRFDNAETALFVANTGDDTIVKIPIDGGRPESGGAPGKPVVFVNGINGADGLLVDADDNLWVAANQSDEIVVVDQQARAIAKLGDFDGVKRGKPRGLLFPASIRLSRHELLVTNLALDLRLFGLPPSVDSPWTAEVTRYTVSALPARIPPAAAMEQDDAAAEHGRGH